MEEPNLLVSLFEGISPQNWNLMDLKLEELASDHQFEQQNVSITSTHHTIKSNQEQFPKKYVRKAPRSKDTPPILITNKPWLDSKQFQLTSTTFANLLYMLSSTTRIYSIIITNSFGKIIYANKLASQHFQGSLNSFITNTIQQLVIKPHRQPFMNKVRQILGGCQWISYLIYSKSAKRKYGLIKDVDMVTVQDIYFRYLKAVKSNVQPIKLKFDDQEIDTPDSYWNKKLIINNDSKGDEDIDTNYQQCYLFQSCYAQSIPQISYEQLIADETIQKFMKSIQKKRLNKGYTLSSKLHFPQTFIQEMDERRKIITQKKIKMIKNMKTLKKREIYSIFQETRKMIEMANPNRKPNKEDQNQDKSDENNSKGYVRTKIGKQRPIIRRNNLINRNNKQKQKPDQTQQKQIKKQKQSNQATNGNEKSKNSSNNNNNQQDKTTTNKNNIKIQTNNDNNKKKIQTTPGLNQNNQNKNNYQNISIIQEQQISQNTPFWIPKFKHLEEPSDSAQIQKQKLSKQIKQQQLDSFDLQDSVSYPPFSKLFDMDKFQWINIQLKSENNQQSSEYTSNQQNKGSLKNTQAIKMEEQQSDDIYQCLG